MTPVETADDVVPLLKFTPSAQDPKILEELTVQCEPLVATLVESALDIYGGIRHQLLVGPRGIGKTHALSLVASRICATERADSVVLAWLDEDPWAVRTYGKFLAAILARVAAETGDGEVARDAEGLRARGKETDGAEGEELLRNAVGDRRLVLIVENLDEIFRRIGPNGQARLRAFAEDWRQLLILASTPQLFAGVRRHTSPFYGFFAVTHLDELSLASATELLRRIARLRGDTELFDFLGTDTAARRLRAITALAGGHPRIWLLLAGCISIAAIDELVPLFLEALDDLTPYYQDRLRELGDQQQELVVLLSEAGGALSNRALAERSGIAQNQIATLLRQLADRGYIRRAELPDDLAARDRRMSFWELREPLMRLCLDVKQSRGEPLRLVVEFLRAWYGVGLLDELGRLPPDARLASIYASEAFRKLEGLKAGDLLVGSPAEVVDRAERGLTLRPRDLPLLIARATGLVAEGRYAEARDFIVDIPESKESGSFGFMLRLALAVAKQRLGEPFDEGALMAMVLELQEELGDPTALVLAELYELLKWDNDALDTYTRITERDPDAATAHFRRGLILARLGRGEKALSAHTRAIELEPDNASMHNSMALVLIELGRIDEAERTARRAIKLDEQDVDCRLTLAQITLVGRDTGGALSLLREALAIRDEERPGYFGTARLCQALWDYFRSDPCRRTLIAQIVEAYGEAGAIVDLCTGVVVLVSRLLDPGVSQQDADSWVEDWSNVPHPDEFEIPLNLLAAVRDWRRDGDGAHFLALPPEQRQILVSVLGGDLFQGMTQGYSDLTPSTPPPP